MNLYSFLTMNGKEMKSREKKAIGIGFKDPAFIDFNNLRNNPENYQMDGKIAYILKRSKGKTCF